MNLADFFRRLTDLSLDPESSLDLADNTLSWIRGTPVFEFGTPFGDFCRGFYAGINRLLPRAPLASAEAYQNGVALGFRLRLLRREHRMPDKYGLPA